MNKREKNIKQKPQLFLKCIKFNDGTELPLERNSIVVFTGANNCGKSQVLKDIENCFNKDNHLSTVVIKDFECEFLGEIDEEKFLSKRFWLTSQGLYRSFESESALPLETLKNYWINHLLFNELYKLFVKRLSTEERLKSSNPLNRNMHAEIHPIYKLYNSELIAQKISDYFNQAFDVDLVVNRNDMQAVPLHVGKAPDKSTYTIDKQDDYYNKVAAMPKLQNQGDGMRSFASILLDAFTSDYNITLIDEPEAFLHPPQARILGKMLVNNNFDNKQLFISTHSEDFLQGLMDSNSENVIVTRIARNNTINNVNIINNDKIKMLWSNPILRYSNILSGLFHEKVIICESDYDCLFYHAIIDSIYEQEKDISPNILFTHCGGKNRMKDIVNALRAVNVSVVAICDFDILNKKQDFKTLMESFGGNWDYIENDMNTIYDSMNAKNSNGENAWNQIKKIGKMGFTGNEPGAYANVEKVCKSIGLFIVPVGEMECFDKTINKEKKEWVYSVLETYNLSTEPNLEEARKFVEQIIAF